MALAERLLAVVPASVTGPLSGGPADWMAFLVYLVANLTLVRGLAAAAAFLTAAFAADCALQPRYPRALPRVGFGLHWWAAPANALGYVVYFSRWVDEGYHKYSKHGHAFVVPSAAAHPQEIVVPRAHTAWMLDLPDHVLSTHAAHDDVLYSRYNFLQDARLAALSADYADPAADAHAHFHIRVMHRQLARHLPGLLPAIEDEVTASVDDAFGLSAEWHAVSLFEACLHLVPRVTNRLLVGPGLCRNADLLRHLVGFADAVVANSFLLNMVPRLLHPLAGRLAQLPNWRHWRAAHRILEPEVTRRLAMDDAALPEDFISWHIRMARAEGRSAELNAVAISKRLIPVEFAAIHTTVLTLYFVLLDLLASDPAHGFIDGIRAEVLREKQSAAGGGSWTKTSLARLWRTDSAIRESQRVSHFATSLVKRKVVAPQGITSAAEGWHAPPGALLMLNLAGTHHDPDLYADPNAYDAFRFARQREAAAQSGDARRAKQASLLGMVTTSDRHLAFGHGRHACPGRFFVAHEIKMILAHLFTHYDIKPLATRPQPQWVGQTIIPPLDVKVEVRRRT